MSTNAKSSILTAAQFLFGEKGFEGTSIRDISKRAKVNVAMIAYYFDCKERLYTHCLQEYASSKSAKVQSILTAPKSLADFELKLRHLLEALMDSFDQDAPMLKIFLREIQTDKKKINRDLVEVTSHFFAMIRDFFQASMDGKIISDQQSADLLTIIFLGAMSEPVRCEFTMKRIMGVTLHDKEFQKNYKEHLLKIFINGVVQ
ncbi:MAG: TetR/AcrR family transcriptional regulator [Pseudobdellovibrionaceae bacterium]